MRYFTIQFRIGLDTLFGGNGPGELAERCSEVLSMVCSVMAGPLIGESRSRGGGEGLYRMPSAFDVRKYQVKQFKRSWKQ